MLVEVPIDLARDRQGGPLRGSDTQLRLYGYRDPVANFCPSIGSPVDEVGLEIVVNVPATGTGTIDVRGFGSDARAEFNGGTDGSSAFASGGTVTLDEVGSTVSGTFSLEFDADRLEGSFSLPVGCEG